MTDDWVGEENMVSEDIPTRRFEWFFSRYFTALRGHNLRGSFYRGSTILSRENGFLY